MNQGLLRSEIDLAVEDGYLSATEAAEIFSLSEGCEEAFRARVGDEAWGTLVERAKTLRAISRGAERVIVRETPGRYQSNPDLADARVRLLGQGAQGTVEVVWDAQVERNVARKVLRPGVSTARFIREARVLSRLDDPGLPTLYELGRAQDGAVYFTMRYVQGHAISRAESRTELKARLVELIRACKIVAYANSKGVVHRDLKPEHLIVSEFGAVTVLDWGLVWDVGLDRAQVPCEDEADPNQDLRGVTQLGTRLGTAGYRPPEQEENGPISPASDVYALGKVLAFVLGDLGVPPLRSVVAKATRREPGERYRSAAQLGEDLQAWLDHESVQAHRYSVGEGLSTALSYVLERYRRPAMALLVMSGPLAILAMGAFVGAEQEPADRLSTKAQQILQDPGGDPGRAVVLAAESLRLQPTMTEARGALMTALAKARYTLRSTAVVPGLKPCEEMVVHESGLWACTGAISRVTLIGDASGIVNRWKPPTGAHLHVMRWSPSGEMLAGREVGGRVYWWPPPAVENDEIEALPAGNSFEWIDEHRVVTYGDDNAGHTLLQAIDVTANKIIWNVRTAQRGHLNFARWGDNIAVGDDQGIIDLHSVEDGTLVTPDAFFPRRMHIFAHSLDKLVLGEQGIGGKMSRILIRSRDGSEQTIDEPPDPNGHISVAFSSNSKHILIRSGDGYVALWEVTDEIHLHQSACLYTGNADGGNHIVGNPYVYGSYNPLTAVSTSADTIYAVRSDGRAVDVFSRASRGGGFEVPAHVGNAYSLQWSSDGASIWTGGDDGLVRWWSKDGIQMRSPIQFNNPIRALLVRDTGLLAAEAGVGVWRRSLDAGDVATLIPNTDRIYSIRESPDNKWIAMGGDNRKLLLYSSADISSSTDIKPSSEFTCVSGSVMTIAFRSLEEIVTSCFNGDIHRLAVHGLVEIPLSHEIPITNAGQGSIDPGGDVLALGDKQGKVNLFSLPGGARIRTLSGHPVWQYAVVQKAGLVASGALDGSIRIWRGAAALATLSVSGRIWDLAFSPDGHSLAAVTGEGMLYVWRLTCPDNAKGCVAPLTLSWADAEDLAHKLYGLVYDASTEDVVYEPER